MCVEARNITSWIAYLNKVRCLSLEYVSTKDPNFTRTIKKFLRVAFYLLIFFFFVF